MKRMRVVKNSDSELVLKPIKSMIVKDDELVSYKPMLVDEYIKSFSNCPWHLIANVARANKIPSTWHLGDEKTITLTNGEVITCRICDLTPNRYEYSDGSGSTHMVIEFKSSIATKYAMNSGNTNEGGWNGSEMRTRVNSGVVWDLLPSDLKSVLKEVKTKAMNGGKQDDVALTESDDKVFLAHEREIFGTRTYCAQAAWNAMTRFQLYANNDTASFRIKQRVDSADIWWLRSTNMGSVSHFINVSSEGNVNSNNSYLSRGISLFFAF